MTTLARLPFRLGLDRETMKLVYGLILLGCLQSLAGERIDQQVLALSEVKMSLNDSRGVMKDWGEFDVSVCTIPGVVCGAHGEVVQIDLSSSGLSGVLSPSIGKLKTLQRLYLHDNNITGGIPEEIGNISSLITLKLQKNQFNGSISDSLGHLIKLEDLDLSQNLLTGDIPSSLSNIQSLNSINLAYNKLTGAIPEQLLHVSRYNYRGNHLNCGPHLISCEGSINNRDGSTKSTKLNVVLGSVGAIALILVVICVAMCVVLLRHRQDLFFDVAGDLEETGHKFTWQELEIATDNFDKKNLIGEGRFSKVYKGFLPSQQNVAIKRLKRNNDGSVNERDFTKERQVKAVALHKNVLKLLGYCTTSTERILVYPFMENLSLSSWLRGSKCNREELDWTKRMRIARGIAHGLEYLHDHCNPAIIHRDIKAANILLNGEFEAILGDFGLVKIVEKGSDMVKKMIQGTWGYVAPEVINEGKVSKKSDVYSYGVLLLEIVTGMQPQHYDPPSEASGVLHIDKVRRLMQEGRLEAIADNALNNPYAPEELAKVIKTALMCVNKDSDARPRMSEIVRILKEDSQVGWEEWQRAQFTSRQHDEIEEVYSLGFSKHIDEIQEVSKHFEESEQLSGGR